MVEYVEHIILPYVEKVRVLHGDDTPALVIMDNFKGQVTDSFMNLLESHNIHVCLLPPNTTDRLQPMDISVNKPAKDFLKRQWYFEQVVAQLEGEDTSDLESIELEPINFGLPANLGLPALKEIGAKWLVEMEVYICDNPQIIVNGFIHLRITAALDGQDIDDLVESDENSEHNSGEDFDGSEDSY